MARVVGKAPYIELARSFVNTAPQIRMFLSAHNPPLIAKVYRAPATELSRRPQAPGRIELWYPPPAGRRR
jgi:hypothetical protein